MFGSLQYAQYSKEHSACDHTGCLDIGSWHNKMHCKAISIGMLIPGVSRSMYPQCLLTRRAACAETMLCLVSNALFRSQLGSEDDGQTLSRIRKSSRRSKSSVMGRDAGER
jgi:hypothetical protein